MPVGLGEVGEGQDLGLGGGHGFAGSGEQAGELVRDLVPGFVNRSGVGLGEDGPQDGGGHVLVGSGHAGQQVAGEMHPAALAGGALEGPVGGGVEAAVGIGGDQAHPGEAAVAQRGEEGLPESLVLAVADVASQDLAAALRGDPGGDDHSQEVTCETLLRTLR